MMPASRSITTVDTGKLLLRDLENNGEDDSPAAKKPKSEKFPLNRCQFAGRRCRILPLRHQPSASTSPCPPLSLAASSSITPSPIFITSSKTMAVAVELAHEVTITKKSPTKQRRIVVLS
ncbi:uncharacterized protein LOC107608338 isoform X1 [Arachis ipaensis]|uniref:uncharacterized protein LOC107608338 isoform X1 n=1 Tax=Arachis ipaensis TaxID=130454 RepID=UPI000A2B7F5A|nr:uncharacterized protein LOC107608338 isoform X1 [Arachis ipaensis]XP_029150509.1 uncharacterized protein LOC112765990 isoform X1 [Arachis hypogaea]